jgi:hypothetical protein
MDFSYKLIDKNIMLPHSQTRHIFIQPFGKVNQMTNFRLVYFIISTCFS